MDKGTQLATWLYHQWTDLEQSIVLVIVDWTHGCTDAVFLLVLDQVYK